MAGPSRWADAAAILAAGLALAGGVEILLFQGAGARVPDAVHDPLGRIWPLADPLRQAVWPVWMGQEPLPGWRFGERYCRNLVSLAVPSGIARLAPGWQFIQFVPLVLAQGLAILGLWRFGTTGIEERDSLPPDLRPGC